MGYLTDGNSTIKSDLDDDDLEEGEIRDEEVEENMAHLQNSPSYFDDLEEEGEIREETDPPRENSLTEQIEEICNNRLKELLSLQDLELKKFKLSKNLHEMEFEINCSGELSVQDFKILNDKFHKHMRAQYRSFVATQILSRNKEKDLKETWLQKAREGTLEGSFCEKPLPDLGFKLEEFDYESEMKNLIAKNGSSPRDDMHLDVAKDQEVSDFEVSQNLNPKTPSIGTPTSNFESEETNREKNERGCTETPVQNLNLSLDLNSPLEIISNSNLECDEVAMDEHELAETNMQNPNSNRNSLLGTMHSDQIVVSDSTSRASTIPEEHQVNLPINLPCTSNTSTTRNQRLSTERNLVAESRQVNQNEASIEQSATLVAAPDVDVVAHLLQMIQHNLDIDPLQNELTTLQKLQKILIERQDEKKTQLRAEYERELNNTRRKYHQMEIEVDAQWSVSRAHLNMVYQKVSMHQRLAQEVQQMFFRPNFTNPLPIPNSQEQFRPSSHLQFTPDPILRPATQFVVPPPSTSNHGLDPTRYTIPRVIQPRATFAVAPSSSGQVPVRSMHNPRYFFNQPAVLHSSLARAPVGGPGLGSVCLPGGQQFNQLIAPSLSMPSVRMAMPNFRNT